MQANRLLAAWRSGNLGALRPCEAVALERMLRKTGLLREPRWRAALQGDAAAAVAIALDHVRKRAGGGTTTDLVMSNLLVLAVKGDATASTVIAHVVGMLARRENPGLGTMPGNAFRRVRGRRPVGCRHPNVKRRARRSL